MALPAGALAALRRALREEAGALATTHALHAAGYRAGDSMFESFTARLDGPAEDVPEARFWEVLRDFFGARGWGTLRHRGPSPAVGLLASRDWAEAEGGKGETQPACAFTSGLLANLLGRVAGGAVAVLEVSCRSRGDRECAFAFGSEGAIHEIYGRLLEGEEFDAVLEAF